MDDWFDGVADPDDRDLMAEDVPDPWFAEDEDYRAAEAPSYPHYLDEPYGHFGHGHE